MASNLSIDGVIIPTGTENKKTIGIYLKGNSKLETGNITVKNGAIGVYATDNNSLNLKKISVENKAIGIFSNGNTDINLSAQSTIDLKDGSIGIYGNKGIINLISTNGTEKLTIENTSGASTGIYLTNGSSIKGKQL